MGYMAGFGASTKLESRAIGSGKWNKMKVYIRNNYLLYVFLLLPLAYFILFKYVPMYGVLIAFKDYNVFEGIEKSPWNHFATFKEIFAMKDFHRAVINTFFLNFLDLIVGFPAPILLAVLLNELKSPKFKKASQTILYLPHFISWVIIGSMAQQLFSTQTGMINILIENLGGKPVAFLTTEKLWVTVYVLLGMWQGMGWNSIIYLAAISGINSELYEAAEVDGAGRLRKIWHITIPGIKSTIIILLIMQMGRITAIGFDRPYVLGNSLVSGVSDVISTFTYRVGLRSFQFSEATAVGLFQSIVGMIFLLITNYIAEKSDEQGIW